MTDSSPTTANKYTVLYIEDTPAIQRFVAAVLARLGTITLLAADEPRQGLDIAESQTLDLILLDINLPGMNGFEVLKLLRQSETNRHTPVIGLSGDTSPQDIEKALNAGFNGYLGKPMDVTVLMNTVESFLVKKSA